MPACALLIEDDSATSFIFQQVLSSMGLSVTVAHNGEVALACLQSNKYDVIVLDLLLPRVSGIQLLQYRHNMEPFRECPILVVTAHASLRHEITLGPRDHFLLKPLFLRDLQQVVSEMFPRFNQVSF